MIGAFFLWEKDLTWRYWPTAAGRIPSGRRCTSGFADVRDAVHRQIMPAGLSRLFCFERVDVDSLGFAPELVEGGHSSAGGTVFPGARARPSDGVHGELVLLPGGGPAHG